MPFWVVVVGIVWLLFSGSASAAVSISVCGSSTYTCPAPVPSVGDTTPMNAICDVASGKCAFVPNQPGLQVFTPSGWTSPTQPPATIAGNQQWRATNDTTPCHTEFIGATEQLAFEGLVSAMNGNGCYSVLRPFVGTWNGTFASSTIVDAFSNGHGKNLQNMGVTCPAGYTVSGTDCNLTNASLVIKPTEGKCNVLRTGNTFSGDPNDPDCSVGTSGGAAAATGLNVSGGTVSASGGGVTGSVSVNGATGTGQITQTTNNNSTNTTTINTTNISAPPGGTGVPTVTGKLTTEIEGVGDLAGEEVNPQELKIDESGTPTDGTLAGAVAAWDAEKAAGLAALNALGTSGKRTDLGMTFGISWPNVSCTDPSVTFAGHTLTADMCSKQADVNAFMGWLVWVFGAFYLFSMVKEVR